MSWSADECKHPDLRMYNDGLEVHCIYCMRAWVAHTYYPPAKEVLGVLDRTFPVVENNKVYVAAPA